MERISTNAFLRGSKLRRRLQDVVDGIRISLNMMHQNKIAIAKAVRSSFNMLSRESLRV